MYFCLHSPATSTPIFQLCWWEGLTDQVQSLVEQCPESRKCPKLILLWVKSKNERFLRGRSREPQRTLSYAKEEMEGGYGSKATFLVVPAEKSTKWRCCGPNQGKTQGHEESESHATADLKLDEGRCQIGMRKVECFSYYSSRRTGKDSLPYSTINLRS